MPSQTPDSLSWTGRPVAGLLSWLVLAAAAALAFLAAWVVVPAPTLLLLPLGVAVPELSPALGLAALAVAGGAWLGRRRRVLRAASAVALAAAALFAIPIVQLPAAIGRFDRALSAAGLGGDAAVAPRPFRATPFGLLDLVAGIDAGAVRTLRGVTVGGSHAMPLTADLYVRDGARDAPVLVQIYGGAWQRGRPGDDEAFARYFAGRGYLVAAVDYRHAPASRWPAQIDDVEAALGWLRAHAREYGGDPSRLALVGRSAGAQLALVAAYRSSRPVAGVVSFYGPIYLADGWRQPPRPDPLDVRSVLETYLGGTPDEAPAAYDAASPVTYLSASSPPTLLVYGTRDHIVDVEFARRLERRLKSAGVPGALIELPWAEHAFDALPSGLSAQVALFYTERFLDRVFARRPVE